MAAAGRQQHYCTCGPAAAHAEEGRPVCMCVCVYRKVSVRCREVGRLWEGPLREAPL